MKAIIFKELRENLRWAGLVFLITSGLLMLCISGRRFYSGLPLIEETSLTICMLMYPATGLSLGLIQIFLDFRRGRWQFVSHRPISRHQLFAGKLLAGLSLYATATLIPLLAAVAWVATPGHVPGPFAWDMATPALAYLASGVMWYAVGLLIAARKARWYGSRLMPVGVAIVGTFAFNAFAVTFAAAIAIMIPCIALLLVSAWGAFIAGDDCSGFPSWSKPCIGLSVVTGWIISVAVAMVSLGALIDTVVGTKPEPYSRYYFLDPDGNLQTFDGRYNPKTLAGATIFLNEGPSSSIQNRVRTEGFLNAGSHAQFFNSIGSERWYCVARRGTIEGYSSKTGRYIGSFGQDGFDANGHIPRPFGQAVCTGFNSFNDMGVLLVVRNSVFYVNVSTRQVRKVWSSANDDPVLGEANLPSIGAKWDSGPDDCVVVTQSAIHFIHDDREQLAIPREHLQNEYQITAGRTQDGKFVAAYGAIGPAELNPASIRIYDPTGKLVRRADVPAKPAKLDQSAVNPNRWWEQAGAILTIPASFAAIVFTARGIWSSVITAVGWNAITEMLSINLLYLAIAFAMLRSHHATRSQFILWLIVVAALGLSGILLLMSMFEKPKAVRCPGGGWRARPRVRIATLPPRCRRWRESKSLNLRWSEKNFEPRRRGDAEKKIRRNMNRRCTPMNADKTRHKFLSYLRSSACICG